MKEIALQVASVAGARKLNVLREYLQHEILLLMQRTGFSAPLYFVGGTALRVLYGIRRYSEDLDFSAGEKWRRRELGPFAEKLEESLVKGGYLLALAVREEKTVQRVMVRFKGLLSEAGLSSREAERLAVHIEIDTNPPEGWKEERTIVNTYMPILIRHYDKPSLFAAKLAAFFARPYTKGRDVYDLFWIRSKWKDLLPNFDLLNNAISQKKTAAAGLSGANWLEVAAAKIHKLDWKAVVADAAPFLEDPGEARMLTRENFLLLYSK